MKHVISITVELSAYEKHRAAHHNISKLCSNYLEHYFDNQTSFKEEKKQEAKKEIRAFESAKQGESKDKEIKVLLQEALKQRAIHPNKTQLILRNVCDKFGMAWSEAVRRMERI